MYIKIVRHLENEEGVSSSRGGSLKDKVVPTEHHMFECLEALYRKVTVNNISGLHERMNDVESVRVVTPMPDENYPSPFEFIQIQIIKEDDDMFVHETLIGRECTLFIMNNEGKTIDSMVCR